jgi:hypothetical protein
MDEKISWKIVEQYSAGYAHKVADSFFVKKESITGKEILSLCEVQQVNLFVIKELFGAWMNESQKYKSPFFDYEAEEVKSALLRFQTVLSNHISIGRDHFIPLLQKAVNRCLYLVLDPYDYYSDTLERNGKEKLKLEDIRSEIKYLKINRAPLEKLVRKLEEKNTPTSGNEAFAMLDQILEEVSFTPEDVDQVIAQFSKVLPLQIEKLYEKKGEQAQPANRPTVTTPQERMVINEALQVEHRATVADNFQKIARLKESLTINQKFMFTKILFNGDFDLFSKAVEQIDKLESRDQATQFISSHYSHWDKESEEYEEFIELVSKRFS